MYYYFFEKLLIYKAHCLCYAPFEEFQAKSGISVFLMFITLEYDIAFVKLILFTREDNIQLWDSELRERNHDFEKTADATCKARKIRGPKH